MYPFRLARRLTADGESLREGVYGAVGEDDA
jgi:hypothetical protein